MSEGRTDSYRMENLDAESEIARLHAQVRLLRGLETDFLDRAGLQPEDHLLDLGCGPGFFTDWAAHERVPRGRVTGVDVDPTLLEIGRARAIPDGAVEYLLGSATRIPLPDASVDFAYARFLFQHLDQPALVVAEMARVVRPGGTIAIVDTDDGGLMVHPAPEGFDELIRASHDAQAARGGDRHVGRKLKSLLVNAGLASPRVHTYAFTTEDVGPDAFVGITLGFKVGVLGPPWIAEDRLTEIAASLRAASHAPGFFGQATGYGAWARVAAHSRVGS